MHLSRRLLFLVLLICSAGFMAACGGGPSTAATPSPTPTASKTDIVQTISISLNNKLVTILTDAHGKTLYYFMTDTTTTSDCFNTCAATWPPLLVPAGTPVTSSVALPGKLSVRQSSNGPQIQYNGHFLYTYIHDNGPRVLNGEGTEGKWFVVPTDLA
jgi:predicted lipoprotein with Yx(FWY)xxD motif